MIKIYKIHNKLNQLNLGAQDRLWLNKKGIHNWIPYVPEAGLEPAPGVSQTGFWVQRVYQFRHFGLKTKQK